MDLTCVIWVHPTDAWEEHHSKGGKTRSVGWSLNYIRASTTRQAWESFTILLDFYRQFTITGTHSE